MKFLLMLLFVVCNCGASNLLLLASDDDWIREEDGILSFRIRGEVSDSTGKPVERFTIEIDYDSPRLIDQGSKQEIEGSQFEFWLPIASLPHVYKSFPSIHLVANDEHAYLKIPSYELREKAMQGVKVSLQKPSRAVEVRVVDEGLPVVGAKVQASIGQSKQRTRTDSRGIARIELLADQELSGLMAWTNDYRIAGFGFDRKPYRDPSLASYELELDACRDLTIRFVDQSGAPVPNIPFKLHVATPSPNFNFIGKHEPSSMKSDARGESHYRWFPKWDAVYFYVELDSELWTIDVREGNVVDGVATFELKKTKFDERKRIYGRVASDDGSKAGFQIEISSFQGEVEHLSDSLACYSNEQGEFHVDVLPDATYAIQLNDSRKVAKPQHAILYDSREDKLFEPVLDIIDGEPIEIMATIGPDRKPYANLQVGLIKEYNFDWIEKGEKKYGRDATQWWVSTDANGRAVTYAIPGDLKVSIYQPLWRTEQKLRVVEGGKNRVNLHRAIEGKQKLHGRLTLKGSSEPLANASVRLLCLTNFPDEDQTVTTDKEGEFRFESIAAHFAIYAKSIDGKSIIAKRFQTTDSLNLELLPATSYSGRLLDAEGKGVAGEQVVAIPYFEKIPETDRWAAKKLEVDRRETTTDEQGLFTIENLPVNVPIEITVADLESDKIYLEPGEDRPLRTYRMEPENALPPTISLKSRFEKVCLNASIHGFRTLVIFHGANEQERNFAMNKFYYLEGPNDSNSRFMHIILDRTKLSDDDLAFLRERDWPVGDEGCLLAMALDSQGNELGRIELKMESEGVSDRIEDFVRSHDVGRKDAEQEWNHAFKEAKQSGKRVWAYSFSRYNAKDLEFAKFLHQHRETLEKDYVLLKVNQADEKGDVILDRIPHLRQNESSYHAIFEADGKVIIDSEGPLGNIGNMPKGYEKQKHLRKMLNATRRNLSEDEVNRLVPLDVD